MVRRLPTMFRMMRLTQAMGSILMLWIVIMFILPDYGSIHAIDPSSLSIVQNNDSNNEARVSGYNFNYVEDHGDAYDPNMEEFIATHEWQQIKPGQAIPRGLHVRINLQTGMKEAKLLDETDSPSKDSSKEFAKKYDQEDTMDDAEKGHLLRMKENIEGAMKDLEEERDGKLAYWKEGDKQGMMNMGKDTFTKAELKEALKKFKAEKDDVQNPQMVKENYRSMEELKQDMDILNMDLKTDIEIIQELLSLYKNSSITTQQRKDILTDLEYYAHQIDNAQDLVGNGGLDLIMLDLNHTDADIRSEVAFVLGSALQNNPKVQVYVLDTGMMVKLINKMNTEPDSAVINRLLYMLSSLLRQFPYAQQLFLKHAGLQALKRVFTTESVLAEKLKIRTITLLEDLVNERRLAESSPLTTEQAKLKLQQYQKVHLSESLLENGWCQLIPDLLSTTEHDTKEKVLVAMTTLIDTCRSDFASALERLSSLEREYRTLSQEEALEGDTDGYFTNIYTMILNLLQQLRHDKEEL